MSTVETQPGIPRYYLLYLPVLLALLTAGQAITSYAIAWLGSLFIFYISLTNKIKPTSPEVPLAEKLLKPLFLTQIIFAGYMSVTSLFFFMDLLGYRYFSKIYGIVPSPQELELAAACQRYYLLGHAAFTHGLLLFYKSAVASNYQSRIANWPAFCIRTALIAAPVGFVFSRISALSILGGSISGLGLVAATVGLALAIPLRKTGPIIAAGILYVTQLAQALTSGFKEPVIVSVLMLGLFLYPFYKRIITFTFLPVMFLLFAVLPTYVNTFRSLQATAVDAETAKAESLKKVREDISGNNLAETNWEFLTGRLTEIGMFMRYKESTDSRGEYYGTKILQQSAMALIPRAVWSGKPPTEAIVRVRVLENGVVEEYANVSAKPQYIVDAYLSAGYIGIWLALFFYGAYAQVICNVCERLFGGYLFGTVFIYTGVFQFLWRGNCFEFIFNNMLYSVLLLFMLSFLFKRLGVLEEKRQRVRPFSVKPEHQEATPL